MLSAICDSHKQLSTQDLTRLAQLLGISVDSDKFLNTPQGGHEFYYLFYDILADSKKPCAITMDYKWSPDDLFYMIALTVPSHTIELIHSDNDQASNMHSIVFEVDGARHSLNVFDDQPDQILEYIDNLIKDGQFMAIDFLEDSYCWLRAPQGFGKSELEEFCVLTGCQISGPAASEPRWPDKLSINLKGKQQTKIFFVPRLQVITSNSGRQLPTNWAGRILPGQTLQEGIAQELKEMEGYTGRFDFRDVYFIECVKDRQGNNVERYGVYITLRDPID